MCLSILSSVPAALRVMTLCALILVLPGCSVWEGVTSVPRTMPPAPKTPGAVVTETQICIPHNEAAALLLWIERVENP